MLALDALLAVVPTDLVSPSAANRLQQVADRIPEALATRVGLEARLDDDPRVDLLLLASSSRQLGLLAGTDPTLRLSSTLSRMPAWRCLARLAVRSVSLPPGPESIPAGIWLEFDVDDADAAEVGVCLESPGVFLAAAPDPVAEALGEPSPDMSIMDSGSDQYRACGTVAEILACAGQPPGELAAPIRSIAGSGLVIRQLGMFPRRDPGAVRLFCWAPPLRRTPLEQAGHILACLDRAGWTGSRSSAQSWLGICAESADTIHLSLDLYRGAIAPTLGIEVSMLDAQQPRDDPRWDRLFATLQENRICHSRKRAALGGLGREYEVDILSRRRFRQGLHHVKVQVDAVGVARAKAYFGAYEVADSDSATPRREAERLNPVGGAR